jgi:hypothetical protein
MVTKIDRNVDSIGGEDLLKPEIKLVQNTGGDAAKAAGAQPGQFFNTMTNEVYPDGFEFVIVDFTIQRCYWGRDTIGDEPPMCTSMDANSYESSDGKNCHECEFLLDNAAQVQAKERRTRCTKQPGFYGFLLPNLEPFQFRATGISATQVIALISRFKYNRALRNPGDPAIIDYHRFKVSVSSQLVKTTSGSAYGIKIGDITPLQDANVEQELLIASAQMLGQANNLLPEGQSTGEKIAGALADPTSKPPVVKPEAAPQVNVIPPAAPPKRETQTIAKQDAGKAETVLNPPASKTIGKKQPLNMDI